MYLNLDAAMDGKDTTAISAQNILVVFMDIVSNHGTVYAMKDGEDFFAIKVMMIYNNINS